MPTLDFVTCDVFTTQTFGGNPLAVFPHAEGTAPADMQRIAKELNLSETVFVLPPGDPRALRRLRIFTPGMELPLAGHPVVGTWFLLATDGVVEPPAGGNGTVRVHQELAAGVLPVDIIFEGGKPVAVTMTQPAPTVRTVAGVHDRAARVLGLQAADLDAGTFEPAVISAGTPLLAVPVASREALSRCRPDRAILDPLLDDVAAIGIYAVYHERPGSVHVRMFGGTKVGIAEDPATGGAAGPLAAALLSAGLLGRESPSFGIEQGADIGRPSRLCVEAVFEGETIASVRVGGPSVLVSRGTFSY